MTQRLTQILIVHRSDLIGMSMSMALEDAPDLAVTATRTTPIEALAVLATRPVDIVLVDMDLIEDAQRLIRHVRRERPTVPVLAVGGTAEPEIMAGAVAAGASGFLLESAPLAEFVGAVRHVALGVTMLQANARAAARRAMRAELDHAAPVG